MAHSFLETVLYWDQVAEYYLNYRWHNEFWDNIIPFFRNQWFWTPLYFFLILYMPSKYKAAGWWWCLGFLVSFIISDRISAGILKEYFARPRPCNNPALANTIHLIVNCGGNYGFPSSHAANHFSIGLFAAITLGRTHKWLYLVAPLWAALVAYSQVYVGVHYPLDVFCGAILGIATANITGRLFNRYFKKYFTPEIAPGGNDLMT